MREIIFRGLRKDGKGWIYGNLVIVRDGESGKTWPEIVQSQNHDTFTWDAVIPETVGQFTGLKDRNGKEIYEGDIFTADEYPFKDEGVPNYNGEVVWLFAGFQYYLNCVNPDKRGISTGINEIIESGEWMEVIGNIHENTLTNKEATNE